MNAFPDEVLLNILTKLPGTDLLRFKRLNRNFGKLIEQNRKSVQYPKTDLRLEHMNSDSFTIVITLSSQKSWHCIAEYSHEGLVKVEYCSHPSYGEECKCAEVISESYFFSAFLSGSHELQAIFDFVLGRIDVNVLELDCRIDRSCVSVLTTSIEYSVNKIEVVNFRLNSSYTISSISHEHCDLLNAVVNEKRKYKNKPCIQIRTEMQFIQRIFRNHLIQILQMTDISQMFRKTSILVSACNTGNYISLIKEEWHKYNFPLFFELFVVNDSNMNSIYHCWDKITFSLDTLTGVIKADHWRLFADNNGYSKYELIET